MSDGGEPAEPEERREKTKRELHQEDPEAVSDDSDEGDQDGGDEVDAEGASARPSSSSAEEVLRRLMGGLDLTGAGEERPERVLGEVSLRGVADYVLSGRVKKVVTMAGAGISTSAGIPDFRTPGTGLYDNLQEYDLPDPQAIFTLSYFRQKPEPFFRLARELYPGNFRPTPSHLFVRLLEEKGLLLRHYTQNIDTLERAAGISGDRLVEAHGTFHTAHCIGGRVGCRKEYSQQFVKDAIFDNSIPTCDSCNSLVKPDIVFFGEALPDRFHRLASRDLPECDLLIIMGTSLTVHPFAGLVDMVGETCPRLLINMEKVGDEGGADFLSRLMGRGGMDFDSERCYRDVARLGPCDEGVSELVEMLGWTDDFQTLLRQHGHGASDNEEGEKEGGVATEKSKKTGL